MGTNRNKGYLIMAKHSLLSGADLHFAKIRRGSGTPVGSVTPSIAGELYRDTTANKLWEATGTLNTNWEQLTGSGAATTFTTGSVIFASTLGSLSENNANFFFDDSSGILQIGPRTSVSATATNEKLRVLGANDATPTMTILEHKGTGGTSSVVSRRNAAAATGTYAAVTSGQVLGNWIGSAWYSTTGTDISNNSSIDQVAGGTWSSGSRPTYISLSTTNTSETGRSERARISPEGHVLINSSAVSGLSSTAQRIVQILGNASADVNSTGALKLVNNRPTATTGDVAGYAYFQSLNNGSGATDKDVAQLITTLRGTGGTSGFGGRMEFHVKADNVSGMVEQGRFEPNGEFRLNAGMRFTLDATNGGTSVLNYYREATNATTFTHDSAGGTSSSVNVVITRIGRQVTIFIPGFTCLSGLTSTTLLSDTALPTWARPATTFRFMNSNYATTGTTTTDNLTGVVFTTGIIRFDVRAGGTNFLATTTTDVPGQHVTYSV